MNKKYLFTLLPVVAISLTSCGNATNYKDHLDDYVHTMKYYNNFTVLQLTDIHWNVTTDGNNSKNYINKVIEATEAKVGKINLIEITGDSFMLSNMRYVKSFVEYFDSLDIPYAIIWGNHDQQGRYNPTWLSNQFRNAKNAIYIEPDHDDLYGRSNFVINLMNGSETKWQITNLDSGASYSELVTEFPRGYDYIREDQTDWWVKEHEKVGHDVPNITYYHIPQQQNQMVYELVEAGDTTIKNRFFKLEGFAEGKKESPFFDTAKNNGLKGCFMGHAHAVDWTFDYEGVTVGLGVKTGKELYYGKVDVNAEETKDMCQQLGLTENFDLVGASLVTLHDDKTFDLDHLYLNERESGNDFVRWVSYNG